MLVGTGNDLDAPGFLQSFDPETGKLQWKFYTVPMKPGDPGLDTWPSLDAARHGGGQAWIPGVYDPETRLYIFGTGNPTPGYTGVGRKGDNLFTCSLVAVERRHRQDGVVLPDVAARHARLGLGADADPDRRRSINGRPRKLVSTASRNGYFFTLDRVTGEHIVTSKYGTTTNWAKGLRPTGVVDPNPERKRRFPARSSRRSKAA